MSDLNRNEDIFDTPMMEQLPNSTAVLVLGIISIVGSMCYGVVGLICGIIALVLSSRDAQLYRTQPRRYAMSSYKNLQAGKICAIIGIVISALAIVGVIFYVLFLARVLTGSGVF